MDVTTNKIMHMTFKMKMTDHVIKRKTGTVEWCTQE